jgi:hypothetical protein
MHKSLLLSCILAALAVSACDKSSPADNEEWIKEASISFCKKFLQDARLSERARSITEQVLRNRQNGRLDSEPVLIAALLVKVKKSGAIYLVLAVSDEDGDLGGIEVEERHLEGGHEPVIIREEYPIFGYGSVRVASFQSIPVTIRKKGQGKNKEFWKRYQESGVTDGELMPTVWVSIPQPAKVDVQIWIYDHSGGKSGPVTLENRLVYSDANN